jgi:hypothetical protein
VVNTGTSAGDDALAAVKIWADITGDGASAEDVQLGELVHVDSSWEITGLRYPLAEGPNRFFITVDVANEDFAGGTLRFEIPIRGVEYWSDTDGPDDLPVGNPEMHFVLPANRITVISIPKDPSIVYPGTPSQVLSFALYNGYVERDHVLEKVRFSNRSQSKSTSSFADYELGQVSLYYDQNKNRVLDDDLLLATGYFDQGRLAFNGLGAPLPAESLSYFFVRASIPLAVIDGDTLAVVVEEHSDFTFGEAVTLNGDLPLDRGGSLLIDGSVRDQYEVPSIPGRTLSPGDEDVTFLAFRPALNGDQVDTLTSIVVVNADDADTSDIAGLSLWSDANSNGIWEPTDISIGDLSYSDGAWRLDDIGLRLYDDSPTLLVNGAISPWATANVCFRPEIPIEGCQYSSANDGPVDRPILADHAFVVSSSPLIVAYEGIRSKYSVGQRIDLKVDVINMTAGTVDAVSCEVSLQGDTGAARLDSTLGAVVDLAPGEKTEFEFFHTGVQQGSILWQVRAFSTTSSESSATIETEAVLVQSVPTGVDVDMVSSIPAAVTRGQSHVFPLSLRCRHLDDSALAASVRLDSLAITVEDGDGAPQSADMVFSRMVLATGYTNLAIVETFPPEPTVTLRFSQPVLLASGQERIVSLRVDIDSLAPASAFALAVRDTGAIRFSDTNTGFAVPLAASVVLPLRTASCAVNDPSQYLGISYIPTLPGVSNYGQEDVEMLKLILRHGGESDDSQIQMTRLTMEVVDESGEPIDGSGTLERIALVLQQSVIGEVLGFEMVSSPFTAVLTAPPVLSPGHIDTVSIRASIGESPVQQYFGIRIADSTCFVVRDISSGALIPVAPDPSWPPQEAMFPISSGTTRLKHPAHAPAVCLMSGLPASVIAGSDTVPLIELGVAYAGCHECSPVCIRAVRVGVLDSLDRALDAYQLFDRIGSRVGGGEAQFEPSLEVVGGYTVFHLGAGGVVLDPGESAAIQLVADLEPDTPFGHFILEIGEVGGIELVDGTDATRSPGLTVASGCGQLPFDTDPVRVFLPAGRPVVKVDPPQVQIAYPGQKAVVALEGELVYAGSGVQGDLIMKRWHGRSYKRLAEGLVPVPTSRVFDAVHLVLDDHVVATDSTFKVDSLRLHIAEDYVVSQGSREDLKLVCDVSAEAGAGNYIIEFADSSFAEFRDYNLLGRIYPDVAGGGFPLLTADISIVGANLAGSFTNWPNPFNPASEVTTIGFVLDQDAWVDVEMFTLTGELVARLAVNEYRSAGPYEIDTWTGHNGSGHLVLPGTYYCRMRARYNSGNSEELKRKVAVVR